MANRDEQVRETIDNARGALARSDDALSTVHSELGKLAGIDWGSLAFRMSDAGMDGVEATKLCRNAMADHQAVQDKLSAFSTYLDLLANDLRNMTEDFDGVVAERKRAGVQ